MHKLQKRLIAVVVAGILLASVLIGATAIYNFSRSVSDTGDQLLSHTSSEYANTLNETFQNIESLTWTLNRYSLTNLDPHKLQEDPQSVAAYLDNLKILATSIADNNSEVIAIYYRLNPNLYGSTSGFFLTKLDGSRFVSEIEPMDLSQYTASKEDDALAGWYFRPVKAAHSLWISPYQNTANHRQTLSYVQPLYAANSLVGVVGMDIDFTKLCSNVSELSVYRSGYAILLDSDGSILYDGGRKPQLPASVITELTTHTSGFYATTYRHHGKRYAITSQRLENGESLSLIVPTAEIYEAINRTVITVITATVLLSTVVILLTISLTHRIISLSRRDHLTNALNRNAYLEHVAEIDQEITARRQKPFSVLIFDINCLKRVNDEIGHSAGDRLISDAYLTLHQAFSENAIYRIGGDEFVVIMTETKSGQTTIKAQLDSFRALMRERAEQYQANPDSLVISSGVSVYQPDTDTEFEEVFRRADQEMYHDKAEFYRLNPWLNRRL